MAKITVGGHFHDHRTLAGDTPVSSELRRLAHGQHVHAVDPDARDVFAAFVEVRIGTGACRARSHTVAVVLANEYARQLPEFSHVVRLEHLSLVRGTVTVQGNAHVRFTTVFVCEGDLR